MPQPPDSRVSASLAGSATYAASPVGPGSAQFGRWWSQWRWVAFGIAVSLPFHLSILLWLANVIILKPVQEPSGPLPIEVSLLPEGELDEMLESRMPDVSQPAVDAKTSQSDPLDIPDTPVAGGGSGVGALDGSSGAGGVGPGVGPGTGTGRGDPGIGNGSGGTSFFGVRARGTRFAYVVDKSGSMAYEGKWPRLVDELLRSLHELPDSASFSVVFFDTTARPFPPDADGWERARRTGVDRFVKWGQNVNPGGGTEPIYGFNHLFSLDIPPDAIFFMTDGEIPPEQAQQVAAKVSRRSRPIAIHCIQFEDRDVAGTPEQKSQARREVENRLKQITNLGDLDKLVKVALDMRTEDIEPGLRHAMVGVLNERILRQIAKDTGGGYRFVPVGGGRP